MRAAAAVSRHARRPLRAGVADGEPGARPCGACAGTSRSQVNV